MNGEAAPVAGMPSVVDWLRYRLEDDQLADLRPGTTVAPADERRAALAILDEPSRALVAGLCHGEASLANVIRSGQAAWKLIDPRGMTGDAAYDLAVLASRVAGYLPPQDIASLVATAAGMDPERVRAWMTV